MWSIIDVRYLLGEATLQIERVNKPRESDVQYLHSSSPSICKDFISYIVISVQALCNITLREKPLVQYGTKYNVYGTGRV